MTWDLIRRIGLGYLKKTPKELGLYKMRELLNAYEGYADEQHEFKEQIRIVSYYSYVGHLKHNHGLKIADLYSLPGQTTKSIADQEKKQEVYKTLEKWSK